MSKLMKFLHTMGAVGLMGAMASLLVLLTVAPDPGAQPNGLAEYALIRQAMDGIARMIFLPSLALTLIAGLLSLAVNRSYQNAGWALAKLATGVLMFEWGFVGIQGPMQNEAALATKALAGQANPADLALYLHAEWWSLWILLGVATVNILLAVWRPRFTWLRFTPK